jgi:hypothetical protein
MFDFLPIFLPAIANVVCASDDIHPKLIAPPVRKDFKNLNQKFGSRNYEFRIKRFEHGMKIKCL